MSPHRFEHTTPSNCSQFFHPPVGDHGDDGSLIVILCLDIDDERSDAVKFGALVSFQAIDSAGRYFIAVFDYTLI